MNPPALRFAGVAKRYAGTTALDDVDLDVAPGECVGLLGVNGAGKTTLLRCLFDFTRPDRGEIAIFGQRHRLPAARAPLAFLPERFVPPDYMSGREFLRFYLRLHRLPYREADALALLSALELDGEVLARRTRAYSKGMTQKLGIAACLLADKPACVLDEPASGLDPKARALVRAQLAALRARGRTVLLTTHDLADAEILCDRVAILHEGRLRFSGTPSDCRARYDADSLDGAFLRAIA